jgi:N-acetylglucosamine-6-phosphate deacetylase
MSTRPLDHRCMHHILLTHPQALPYLGPSGKLRLAEDGSESLGAHCEGPFLSPTKNGIHNTEVLLDAPNGLADLEDCYGSSNLGANSTIKMITAAPELGTLTSAIPAITSRGIVYSVGHSEATYEQASAAVEAGANMITHLFNAMRPLHHRNPGIFGVLGKAESIPRPYFGVISDGEHLHPTSVKIAFNAHPDGFILVTDAMRLVGMPDGVYDWTNGQRIVKKGALLTLEGSDKIAGSSITLVECVSNFLNWTGANLPEAIGAVTSTPAKMLGLDKVKGCLDNGADADLCILTQGKNEDGGIKLIVDQVWKFGTKVYDIAK